MVVVGAPMLKITITTMLVIITAQVAVEDIVKIYQQLKSYKSLILHHKQKEKKFKHFLHLLGKLMMFDYIQQCKL